MGNRVPVQQSYRRVAISDAVNRPIGREFIFVPPT